MRRALDELLRRHPHFDLVAIDWQIEPPGPWVLVDLGQPSDTFDEIPAWAVHRFAVWKATGYVYGVEHGAVTEDPYLWSVFS